MRKAGATEAQYAENPEFLRKAGGFCCHGQRREVDTLLARFGSLRRSRPDGSCSFTAGWKLEIPASEACVRGSLMIFDRFESAFGRELRFLQGLPLRYLRADGRQQGAGCLLENL